MELGKRIAALRKSRGMTQEQLGERLGASRQAVSKWEAGKATPELDLIIKMGEVFGVTLDDLILGRTAPPTPPADGVAGEPPQEPPQKTEREGGKRNGPLILSVVLSAVGFAILCLCPMILDVYWHWLKVSYQGYWPNPIQHFFEWPLLGVLILGVTLFIGGIVGICRSKKKREES